MKSAIPPGIMHIRRGRLTDLPGLLKLEADCFEPERRDEHKSILNSLKSPHQEVWVAVKEGRLVGSVSMRFHPVTCRLYSIAVAPEARGHGLGRQFLTLTARRARLKKCSRIHLEADAGNRALIEWYQANGYHHVNDLPDYYAPGWKAIRLRLDLTA